MSNWITDIFKRNEKLFLLSFANWFTIINNQRFKNKDVFIFIVRKYVLEYVAVDAVIESAVVALYLFYFNDDHDVSDNAVVVDWVLDYVVQD